jgi:hypothetical protein
MLLAGTAIGLLVGGAAAHRLHATPRAKKIQKSRFKITRSQILNLVF